MKQRVMGFDVARALAIFGMVIVNFKIALNAETGTALLQQFAGLFEGRASALFVILAGIGIAFLTRKALTSRASLDIQQTRHNLLKRGALLIVIGLAFTPIWEADILHFYGFYFLIAALLFPLHNKHLISFAIGFVLAFPVLMMLFDYDQGWHWKTYTYIDFWTFEGMFRHVFFNGFHPVFPWCGYLIFGMWLGRQDLSKAAIRWRIFKISVSVWLITESILFALRILISPEDIGLSAEETRLLLSASAIPPLPQYMISAASSATAILMMCLHTAERYPQSQMIRWLNQTGQLSLTLYVAHVVIGMGTLEALGYLNPQPIDFALLCAGLFCVTGVVASVIWLRYFRSGPLEWLFRKIA